MEITTWVVIGCLPSRLERQGAAAADVRTPAPVPATAALLPQLAPALSPSARLRLAGGCRRALLQADTVVRSFGWSQQRNLPSRPGFLSCDSHDRPMPIPCL